MKKLGSVLIGIIINVQFSQAQAPFTTPDNIGSGNCLQFNGTSNYVDCGDINSGTFDDVNNLLTIETWIYPTTVGVSQTISSKYNTTSGSNNRSYAFEVSNGGTLAFTAYRPGNNWINRISDNPVILPNTWQHVAAVMNLSTQQSALYLNGIAVASSQNTQGTPPSAFANSASPVEIGSLITSIGRFSFWNGQIDEFRIWNTARTQTEIKNNMCKVLQGNESGLVSYWNMNEGTGSTVTDLTSNGNNGTLW